MHWINVMAFILMLMSGLMIFNAHPTLYWGDQSYAGAPVVLHIEPVRDAKTGAIRHAFPGWITIPGYYSLAASRRWHFFFMWVLVANGIAYVLWSVLSRHLNRDLWPSGRDIAMIGRSIVDHLRFKHPRGDAARHYNVLQKLAYVGVVFGAFPLIILSGFAMSPGLDAVFPGWVDLLGGRQSARTLHFFAAAALVGFTLLHLFLVVTTGLWNNVRSMITGKYAIQPEVPAAEEVRHEQQ